MTAASPATSEQPHIPVMLGPVMAALRLQSGDHMVDGTYGGGGYSRAALAAGAQVSGFDRDPRAIALAQSDAQSDVDQAGGKLTLYTACFSQMAALLGEGVADAVALDLGYSSIQMDDPEYGLTFQADGPLDMRLSGSGPTAADWINSAPEAEIADILFHYGEEPAARRIARAIVADRPFHSTAPLAALIRRVVKAGQPHRRPAKRDPATRSFQAIRIHVNDELGELERGLDAAQQVLKPGGRLAVVSFHSLEDRIVKQFLSHRSGSGPAGSRHLPQKAPEAAPAFERPAKAQRPDDREVAANPRARSAILRTARRALAADDVASKGAASKDANHKEMKKWPG